MAVKPGALVLRGAIRIYQLAISPLLGPSCRHAPSCSEYAAEAIQRFGAWRGSWLAAARISRCHPWGSHGFDPVPDQWPATVSAAAPWKAGHWWRARTLDPADTPSLPTPRSINAKEM